MERNHKDHRQRMHDAYIELAVGMQPNAFVTLAANDYGHLHEMTRLIGRFCGMVDRELLGHKWHKLPVEKRLNGIFFIEHTKTNIHAHGLLKFPETPDADLPLITALKWNRLTNAGDTNFQFIDGGDRERVAGYCTKEMKGFLFNGDQVVLASQFMTH